MRLPLAVSGLTLYQFGGPMFHVMEGRPWKGTASFAMRLIPPLVVATSGSRACETSYPGSCGGPDMGQLAIGVAMMPAIALVDALFLANDDASTTKRGSVRVEPWVDPGTRRVGAGVQGVF
jgi:hypothetical protein